MKPFQFVPPVSIAAAVARIEFLGSKVRDIDAQLSERKSPSDQQWRGGAIGSKAYTIRELRATKAWLKAQRVFAHAVSGGGATHPNHTFAMLARAYRVLMKLAVEVDLEPDEQKTIHEIRDFMTHQMPPVPCEPEVES